MLASTLRNRIICLFIMDFTCRFVNAFPSLLNRNSALIRVEAVPCEPHSHALSRPRSHPYAF